MMESWSDEAVSAAATDAGALRECLRVGRPPSHAREIKSAAARELGRRSRRGVQAVRRPAPVEIGGDPAPHVILGLLEEPFARGILRMVGAVLVALGPRRSRILRRPAILAAQDRDDIQDDEPDHQETAELTAARQQVAGWIESQLELRRLAEADWQELPYHGPHRHLVSDLIGYGKAKIEDGGRRPPARRLEDPDLGLPSTALAVLNAGSIDYVRDWVTELNARQGMRIPRRNSLIRMHRQGLEILRSSKLPDLGRPEPGPPRGIWPPPEIVPDDGGRKAASGRKLAEVTILTPPG